MLWMDELERSCDELMLYRQAGGISLVDAQPVLAGRMAEHLQEASARTGVNIVAVTGFHKTIFYETGSYIFRDAPEKIAALYISEVEEGMLSSMSGGVRRLGCRAGVIKVALDTAGITGDPTYQKLFEAAASAVLSTGAPVMCHVEQGADALEVLTFFAMHGVRPERVILCHLDRARYDLGYHRACLEAGAFLEYDTINRVKYHDDAQEADLICAMLEGGYVDQLLLGLDTTRARLKSYGGDMGLDYLAKTFLPYLKARGVTEMMCEQMVVENPRRALNIPKEKKDVSF